MNTHPAQLISHNSHQAATPINTAQLADIAERFDILDGFLSHGDDIAAVGSGGAVGLGRTDGWLARPRFARVFIPCDCRGSSGPQYRRAAKNRPGCCSGTFGTSRAAAFAP